MPIWGWRMIEVERSAGAFTQQRWVFTLQRWVFTHPTGRMIDEGRFPVPALSRDLDAAEAPDQVRGGFDKEACDA